MKNTTKGSLLLVSLLVLPACEVSEELVQMEGSVQKITRVMVKDSFERDSITDSANSIHWRGFIWDWGTPIIGTSGRDVAAVIVGKDSLGEASDGEKALYFYGRQGTSVHDIFLITQTFDLSDAAEVELSFDYLTFMLNDAADVADGVNEYLKVDVCSGTTSSCGVDQDLNATQLKTGPWQTVFLSDGSEMPSGLNGKNHLKSDWKRANISLDISQFEQKSHFTFRLAAKMRDGFVGDKMSKAMEDGAAVDNITALAVKYEIDGIPVDPPTEECDPELPFTDPQSCDYIPVVDIEV